jgi:hypothetical protein
MKTLEQLKIFCEGYARAYVMNVDMDLTDVDDWLEWGGYDINLIGLNHAEQAGDGLYVAAYPDNWRDTLPDPIYTFNI